MTEEIEEKKYHGLTLNEIKNRFLIHVEGTELSGDLKYINAKLARLWQEVSYFYRDAEVNLTSAKRRLARIEEELLYKEELIKHNLLLADRAKDKNTRMSDSARNTSAIIQTRTEELMSTLANIKDIIQLLQEEQFVWKDIKESLAFVSKRIDSSGMNNAVEAKLAATDPLINSHQKSIHEKEQNEQNPEMF
jgi:hypothetical protein